MAQLQRFKHTEKTVEIYNNILTDYYSIKSDSELEKIGIDYATYESNYLGILLDTLRFTGNAITENVNVANWLKGHGCIINDLVDSYGCYEILLSE